MTDSEILELARNAGIVFSPIEELLPPPPLLAAFARLVAEEAARVERLRAAAIILDDASAITYQTMGQYRTAMAKAIRSRTE